MKIQWEIVRRDNIERLKEIYSNPPEESVYLIRESTIGWIKQRVSRKEEKIPRIQILSGGFKTLEECQNYITKIEKDNA